MKKILALFVFLAISQLTKAQYNTGIGARGGFESGLTVKQFISDNIAIEGILGTGTHYNGVLIGGLLEIHKEVGLYGFKSGDLNWFYGIGAHVGFFNGTKYYRYSNKFSGKSITTVSIDGIIGLEYQFNEVPICFSVDFKPYFDFIPMGYPFWGGGGSVRYVFK